MATVLRTDFTNAAVGLTLPAQKKHLQELHDWLINDHHLPEHERVVALTNYQQGRFGRMPTHILLVTDQRLAYTHDGGMRAIPLSDLDHTRIGLNAGLINAEITLALRTGETLTFRRGMSIGMQQVAHAISTHGPRAASRPTPPSNPAPTPPPSPPSPPADSTDTGKIDYTHRGRRPAEPQSSAPHPSTSPGPGPTSPPSAPAASREERTNRGQGDNVIEFNEPVTAPLPIALSGRPDGFGIFAVWALDENLQRADLLVNTADPYEGVVVIGHQQPIRALQVESTGNWTITPLMPTELPAVEASCSGYGDAVIMVNSDLSPTPGGLIAAINIDGAGAAGVWAWGDSPSLLVNQLAPYTGTVVVPPGTQYLTLTASGPWTISRQ